MSYNGFKNGALDLLLSNNVGDKLSWLAEITIEEDMTNQPGIDAERAYLKYTVGDWLQISAGRTHTALGYWNDTYTHGTWFQVPIEHPYIYRFEDQGGLLPTHSVGLKLSAASLGSSATSRTSRTGAASRPTRRQPGTLTRTPGPSTA